jgi:peptidoglycan-N-acetylglucosamine deacetylase
VNPFVSSFWQQRLAPRSRQICLTFDDGPNPKTTPALIKCLSDLHIPAVHFWVGEHCAQHPSLLDEIPIDGQLIANHGYKHRSFLWQTPGQQLRSLSSTTEILAQRAAFRNWFRPPFGQMNPWTASIAKSLGYQGILWSVIAKDWVPQDEQELWARIKSRLHDGAIIVLHDGHTTTKEMIKILPRLAEEVNRRGWKFTQHIILPESS